MTIAFISDLHLTPDRPESDALFAGFVESSAKYLDALYILGDLFEYWVGDDASDDLGYLPIEKLLQTVNSSGTNIYFIHGNRDFLVGDAFSKRTGCTLLPDPYVIELSGQRVLLSHGDALCTDDVEHQQKRKEMLTSKWKMAFEEKPVQDRIEFAGAVRKKSEHDKQSKPMDIMDVNQTAVEDCMRLHDVTRMIHGHTHKPAVHEFELDGKRATRYVLGDWYTQNSVLYFNDGVLTLR